MRGTKITRERVRNHFQYSWWKYLALAVAAFFGWSLLFTTTAYRAPREKRLDVYFVTEAVPQETLEWLEGQILGLFPDVEDSTCLSIVYAGEDTYYGSVQMSTYMAAGEGDIYILTSERFDSLKNEGAFAPLDGALDLHGIDASRGTVYGAQGAPETVGIPAASLGGFREHGVKPDDLFLCVMSTSVNRERACALLDWLVDTLYTAPAPSPAETTPSLTDSAAEWGGIASY